MLLIEDYLKYLSANTLTENESDMLVALADAGEQGLTASELAKLLGLTSHAVANRIFGGLGHKISDFTGKRPEIRDDGTYRWWRVLADDREEERGFVWIIHSSAREALQQIKLIKNEKEPIEAEEIPENISSIYEGAIRKITVNSYERNPIARKRCIKHWGTKCQGCGFDFESKYGEVGRGYVHVHHLVPLSEVKSSYEVDPVADMRPVCANCHAIIHRCNPPLSLEELQSAIVRQS
jgi:predicted HNH restriction endonuclease